MTPEKKESKRKYPKQVTVFVTDDLYKKVQDTVAKLPFGNQSDVCRLALDLGLDEVVKKYAKES